MNSYRILVEEPEGDRLLLLLLLPPRYKWEDNIYIDVREIGRGHVD
jgi:hypothetical protein